MIKISPVDTDTLSDEVLEIGPVGCMECGYEEEIPIQYYLVQPEIETEKQYNELESLVKQQLGFESFNDGFCDQGQLISVCRCPKCNSEAIFFDV